MDFVIVNFTTEAAPLLQHVSHPDETQRTNGSNTFSERVSSAVQEPLTPFTKILLVLLLVLLLLSSVFIGLFAGAQHKLNSGKGGGSRPPVTETHVETQTQTETHTGTSIVSVTMTQTQTSVGVTTTVSVSTSTSVSTTTVVIPAPGPTGAPEEVSAAPYNDGFIP